MPVRPCASGSVDSPARKLHPAEATARRCKETQGKYLLNIENRIGEQALSRQLVRKVGYKSHSMNELKDSAETSRGANPGGAEERLVSVVVIRWQADCETRRPLTITLSHYHRKLCVVSSWRLMQYPG